MRRLNKLTVESKLVCASIAKELVSADDKFFQILGWNKTSGVLTASINGKEYKYKGINDFHYGKVMAMKNQGRQIAYLKKIDKAS